MKIFGWSFLGVIKVFFFFFNHNVTIRKKSLSNSIPFYWLNYIDISSHKLQLLCVCVLSHNWLFATPMDCSIPDSSVHGISQARILEWVAISFSRVSSWPKDQTHISCISCIGRWILYHPCHLRSPRQAARMVIVVGCGVE